MKKFRFPLETLLKVRTERFKALKIALFEAEYRFSCLQTRENEKNGERKRASSTVARQIKNLSEELQEIHVSKEELQKELLYRKNKVKEAFVERKCIEKIKEKRYALWYGKLN